MRSIRIVGLLILSFLCIGITFADFSVDSFVSQLQTASANLSVSDKKAYYLKVYNSMSLLAIRNRADAEKFTLYTTIKEYMKTQIALLGTGSSSSVVVSPTVVVPPISGMTIPKVDLVKVRNVWLSLHNAERKTKGLTPFVYSSALEGTASTWANYLASRNGTTHKRKSTDGYYSYESIKQWFVKQGIVFAGKEKNGQTLFTENLGRNMYSCKKTDCTDDFIAAIKKSRMFFMSEKGKKSKPHYNAIVGNYSTIGLGVALVGNKYYLVTHYTHDLK